MGQLAFGQPMRCCPGFPSWTLGLGSFLVALGTVSLFGPRLGWSYTPQSPEVRELIEGGMAYLEKQGSSKAPGGQSLVALVFLKDGQVEHPRVAEALAACKKFAEKSPAEIARHAEVYSLGLAITFLCELDPLVHRPIIDRIMEGLYLRQKPNGGFGYVNRNTGDTSMTQYAVLALWTAHRSGVEVSGEAAKDVCEWLLRTQDPGGAWGYQGTDPGQNNQRLPQQEIRLSMAAAGLGSCYILSDLLRLNQFLRKVTADVPDVPAALVPVPSGATPLKGVATRGLAQRMKRAMLDGDAWLQSNFEVLPTQYPYYYLYALERCQSFRELAWGESANELDWYDAGVRALMDNRDDRDHTWTARRNGDKIHDTAFALLFLQQGTKKSIRRSLGSGSGLLVGGRGLPSDVRNVRLHGGRLVSTALSVPAADLLDILEDPGHPDLDDLLDNPARVLLGGGQEQQLDQLRRFRRLVRSEDYRVRRLAVTVLAGHREMDSVPYLIYAVTDPDDEVSWVARRGLRFISRNLRGADAVRFPDEQQKQSIADVWKKWYTAIRPNAQFIR